MFSSAVNPYDELVTKATDENLASEDWDVNLQICDKVGDEGETGARNAVAALVKRLSHRNPNVQIYALELANTLAQNCGKTLHQELSSRAWTGALSRLINDRATAQPVQTKALRYVKEWARQFEESGDANLGLMSELYDQLRAKNFQFDEPEPAPEDQEEIRRRREEEELAAVIELSKKEQGGRSSAAAQGGRGSATAASSSQPAALPQPAQHTPQPQQAAAAVAAPAQTPAYNSPSYGAPSYSATTPQADPQQIDPNTATRVRALYTFTSDQPGELSFERGDVIKVLSRGYKEWWRGACNGKIGIFPVTYIEALPEPTASELQEEAQEEARVFGSLGLVDRLLEILKKIDPSRGERLQDNPEVEELYQSSVAIQGQINALIKKYSDQQAELANMNINFGRAIQQYEALRGGVPPQAAPQQPFGYGAPPQDPYQQAQQQQQQPPNDGGYHQQQPPHDPYQQQQQQQQQHPQQQYGSADGHGGFPQPQPHVAHGASHGSLPGVGQPGQPFHYPSQEHAGSHPGSRNASGAPPYPPGGDSPQRQNTGPGNAGVGAGEGHFAAAPHQHGQQGPYAYQQPQQQYVQQPPTESPGVYGQPGGQPGGQQGPQAPQGAQGFNFAQQVADVANGVGRMNVQH